MLIGRNVAKAPSVRRACIACHAGKTRCSEVLPCQACLKRGIGANCAYPDPDHTSSPPEPVPGWFIHCHVTIQIDTDSDAHSQRHINDPICASDNVFRVIHAELEPSTVLRLQWRLHRSIIYILQISQEASSADRR